MSCVCVCVCVCDVSEGLEARAYRPHKIYRNNNFNKKIHSSLPTVPVPVPVPVPV